MGDIVEFKKKEEKNNDEFLFTMDVYRTPDGDSRFFLTNINTEDGRSERERSRLHANLLYDAAFFIEAEMFLADEPGSRGCILAAVRIYELGTVNVRIKNEIHGKNRMTWMRKRTKEAWDMLKEIMSSQRPEV